MSQVFGQNQYPGSLDIVGFLRAAGMLTGMTPENGEAVGQVIGAALAASIIEWELVTKYQPFVSTGIVETRSFAWPGQSGVLDLQGGVVGLPSVSLGAGSPLVLGQGFTAGPTNAPQRGRPYNYLDFGTVSNYGGWGGAPSYYFGTGGGFNQVHVTAIWGYSLTLPFDARQAIIQNAAALIAPNLAVMRFGGLMSWTEAGVTENYGKSQYADIAETGQMTFQKTALRYRRVSFGG